jgi:hypothetical protein
MNNEQQPPTVPVGIHITPEQQRFFQRHQRFLAELPKLVELCNKVFDRTLAPPEANEYQALLGANLPDDDPAVIAWEDGVTASNLIFYLGVMACEDFNAVLILSGNGAGFASFVHLRSMYERLVTAMYIAKKPPEARRFAESSPGYKLNFLTRLLEVVPEANMRYDDAFMEQVRKDAEAVKAKQRESICKGCKQPKPQGAWTKVSLDSMAREVDSELEKLYGVIYLEGTGQVHANSLGMERRLVETESGYKYKGISEDEASLAVQFAHRLLLKFIDMQNGHFGLGHEQAIGERFAAYHSIWGESPSGASSAPDGTEASVPSSNSVEPNSDLLCAKDEVAMGKRHLRLEHHLVAFLDVLGQREKFRALKLPQTGGQAAAVTEILRQTAGFILELRRVFEQRFISFESGLTNLKGHTTEPIRPKFVGFSDSFVISVPLGKHDSELVPIVSVFSALSAAATVMLTSLASGHPLRGGIDVGLAAEMGPAEIYGSALERAYLLECKEAEYPRIVIGDELCRYLDAALADFQGQAIPEARLITAIIVKMKEWIAIDSDGKKILDYLGPAIAELAKSGDERGRAVKPIYEFVLAEQKRINESNNTKLIPRYLAFRRYVESRLHLWNLESEES